MRHQFHAAPFALLVAAPAFAQSNVITLLFGFDSARLTAELEPVIDATVAEFRSIGSSTIGIAGASDYNRRPLATSRGRGFRGAGAARPERGRSGHGMARSG